MTTDRLRSALAVALHQQEHDPVEDARGDPPDIICAGDLEIADAILADPAVRAALAECPRPCCALTPAEVERLEAAMDARRRVFTEYVREWKRAVQREREAS